MFWSEEQISKLVHTIFPNGFSSGIEVLANVACLAQHIHHYWENALFGLKPILISVDKKELVIQFFWLKQQTHLPSIVDLLTPPLEHHQGRNGPEGLKLFNTATEKHIQSGEHIVITTDDPENKPLHNFDIMHMQWSLNRLAALCVRAKPLEFDVISDNDDAGYLSLARYGVGEANFVSHLLLLLLDVSGTPPPGACKAPPIYQLPILPNKATRQAGRDGAFVVGDNEIA